MRFFNILSIVCESDTQTTSNFNKVYYDIAMDLYIDENKFCEHPITKKINTGEFIVFKMDVDNVVIDYFYDGVDDIKSCRHKTELRFVGDLKDKIQKLFATRHIHNSKLNKLFRQTLMTAKTYSITPDKSDTNKFCETLEFKTSYYLRKIKSKNDVKPYTFFLESRIDASNFTQMDNNIENVEFLSLHNIHKTYQLLLNDIAQSDLEI